MKAVVTVLGKDTVGIIADMSAVCLAHNVNITDVTQKIFGGELFAMIMLVEAKDGICFDTLGAALNEAGAKRGLNVHIMHEDLFNSMHRI